MYEIELKGTKKSVYLVWSNILGYGLPDIKETYGTEEVFTMTCSISTRHDGIPNQQRDSQVWDGTIIDQSVYDIDAAVNGDYAGEFEDWELAVLSGLFGVEISILGIPDDPWWSGTEFGPEYPYYKYKNGEEVEHYIMCGDECDEEWEDEEWEDEEWEDEE